ncbi:MAG: phospho-N-acetylmuramoyl-pentapeptide-transferase [Endozoicomonadaceae bacterium]|nr:phospho-N-acetylmuramoyl-pentapeptide-transferase [Endozoicomonadaceae bacterium]
MLFWFNQWLFMHYQVGLHCLDDVIIRSMLCGVTALATTLGLGPCMIRYLMKNQYTQSIRHDGPKTHLSKTGTLTMGGILIILTMTFSTLLWVDLSNPYYWIVLATLLLFGSLGAADDILKIKYQHAKGLSAKWKYCHQSWMTGLAILAVFFVDQTTTHHILMPFVKDFTISCSAFYAIFAYFVIVGSSNAVNLTDGLDGLAITPILLVSIGFSVLTFIAGAPIFEYTAVPLVPQSHELLMILSAAIGSGLGFLWFNTYPAEIFMGDVGSLALGAMLGIIAVILHQEGMLLIMGGVFVLETISVILQVASFKLTGKRIFRMAPLHHHFELKGWQEPKIIVRFWIINILLLAIALFAIKIT